MVKARATVWVAASTSMEGAKAPRTVTRHAAAVDPSSRRRRPRRSDRATRARLPSVPTRTAARAAPWAAVLRPKSSAAKLIVWVITVPR